MYVGEAVGLIRGAFDAPEAVTAAAALAMIGRGILGVLRCMKREEADTLQRCITTGPRCERSKRGEKSHGATATRLLPMLQATANAYSQHLFVRWCWRRSPLLLW